MELSDDTALTDFIVKSVVPADIQLGTAVIVGDTVKIPVLRGITLFPMSISVEPVFASSTEQAVTGSSFSSFDDIKFDLDDVLLNSFYLVAKSGYPHQYYIKLEIEEQTDRNELKQFDITTVPANSVVASKGFVNPIQKTVTVYGIDVRFPLKISAAATLSDNAFIKDAQNVIDEKNLGLTFSKYGDSIEYNVEAENGAVCKWKVILVQAKKIQGTESTDILSSVSPDPKKQSVEISSGEYKIKEIGVDNEVGNLILVVSPAPATSGISVVARLTARPNSQIIGYRSGETIVFENGRSTTGFIILDSRTGYYQNWQFTVMEGDVCDIYNFPFTYSSRNNYITIDEHATVIDNIAKEIRLQLSRSGSSYYWPLTVTAGSVTASKGATVNIEPFSFKDIHDSAHFSLVSLSGTEVIWKTTLIPPLSSAANIDSVKITDSSDPKLSNRDILVNENAATVFIDFKDRNVLPIQIQPYLYISDGAEFSSFQNGDFMEFATLSDTVEVEIVSASGETKIWKFRLLEKRQLQNSNFELWTTSGVPTIDPVPGKGRGWATANNIMIKGTVPVSNGANGLAAEMTTNIISLIPKNLITSATLFLGYFDMTAISLDKPRTMTRFGVPFEAKPIAFEVDAQYTPGDSYQRSRLVSGSGISAQYVLDNLEGEDRGQMYAELIHWSGEGDLNYDGEPTEGVYVLARGEHIFSGKSEWTRLHIVLERRPEYQWYNPTHIVFVAASSIDGHLFTGAKGSKLTIDNFELIY
jgi:hypothetical protein